MKTVPVTLAGIIALGFLAAGARAQPILERVEKLLRNQAGPANAPPAAAEPGYLGLLGNETPGAAGVRVLQVFAGQPASAAGLRVGDVITKIDDNRIRVMDDMARALAGKPPGTKLTVNVTRQGQEQPLEVTLGRRPGAPAARAQPPPAQPAAPPRLGVRTVPVSETVKRQNNLPTTAGAQVVSVTVGSPAESAGIPLGAIVTAVDGRPVGSPNDLAAAIGAATGEVELTYVHRGSPLRRKVALAGAPVAAGAPQPEMRARPPVAEAPRPSDAAEPAENAPAAADKPQESNDRVAALERRLKELEARIKTLEAALAKEKSKAEPKEN